ncbi:hypothetical protein ACIA8H_35260 [Streptomyces goshikiensis]|uniref:hypothetical protein n=1 Tax=Streptomyces goshikiensis TaxID=1942 RepID=UPI0037936F0A
MNIESYATLGASLAALGVSIGAWRASHRSANAAESSVGEAKRSADASERSAGAAEGATAAAVQGVQIAAASLALQQEAARPKVDLKIRQVGRGTFRLINVGQATAVGLAVHSEDESLLEWHDEWGERLAPRESREVGFPGADHPNHVRFVWDGQIEPVYVEVEG